MKSTSTAVSKMRIEGLIIHLDRAASRIQQVRRLCELSPADSTDVVSAIDGQELTGDQKSSYTRNLLGPSYPFKLAPTEIAAFHSHRSCWQTVVDNDMDAALVLEDDVELDEINFTAAFELAREHISQADIVRFPIKIREKKKHLLSDGTYPCLMTTRSIGLGMVAYIVTRDGAQKLLEKTREFDRPVDTYLQLSWHHKLRILTVWPAGVSEISKDLGGSLIHARKGLKEKLYKEFWRPIYRLKLSAYRFFTRS